MSLVPTSEMLIAARRGGYAVGAFEVWNLESVQAVIAGAEGLSRPVILQVGPYEADYAGLEEMSHIAIFCAIRAAAQKLAEQKIRLFAGLQPRYGRNLKWNTVRLSRS